jgi:hypothetical protein
MREARWWTRILVRTADVSEIPAKTSAAISNGLCRRLLALVTSAVSSHED